MRCQLRGYSIAVRIVDQTFTPALCSFEWSAQDAVGEVRRDVARSPSWRWLCSGRKPAFAVKFPPSSKLTPPIERAIESPRATHSCGKARASLYRARNLAGLSPQTVKLRPGRAELPLGLFHMRDPSGNCNSVIAPVRRTSLRGDLLSLIGSHLAGIESPIDIIGRCVIRIT
jgi:hypothetical protein